MTENNPQVSTSQSILSSLASENGYVSLALTIGAEIVPLGKALVQEIKSISGKTETITYSLLLQEDLAELDAIKQLATDDIVAINAELAKLGIAPLPIPT